MGTDLTLHTLNLAAPGAQDTIPEPLEPVAGWIHFLLASRNGGFWLLANGGIQRYKAGQLESTWGPYSWLTNGTPIIAACEDLDGNLIVGTYGDGVYWLDAKGKATPLGTEQRLSHNFILSLAVDRDGSLG